MIVTDLIGRRCKYHRNEMLPDPNSGSLESGTIVACWISCTGEGLMVAISPGNGNWCLNRSIRWVMLTDHPPKVAKPSGVDPTPCLELDRS